MDTTNNIIMQNILNTIETTLGCIACQIVLIFHLTIKIYGNIDKIYEISESSN